MTSLKILKERNNLAFEKIGKKSTEGLSDYDKVDIVFKIESLFWNCIDVILQAMDV